MAERELYAQDARRMNEHQRRHLGERRRHRREGFPPWTALAVAGGVMAVSALIGRRYMPVLQVLLAIGGYRLMRAAPGRDRDTALALWLFNAAMIGGWTKIFFGERSLAGGSLAAGGMLASGAAYVEFARRVDGVAGAAGVPFAAWLAFATLLSEEVWRRNPD